jgi:hypothetical protein
MTQDQWSKIWKAVASIAVALSVIATALAGISISTNQTQTAEINQLQAGAAVGDVEARASNTPIYFNQGGKQLTVSSGGTLSVTTGGVFGMYGINQTAAVVGINADGAVNGSMFAHGLPGAPTYPVCGIYSPIFPITATVYVSASNATSITLAIVNSAGAAYTGTSLAVRCVAMYVP